jgi:type IV secretory pathway TrbL component
MTRATIIWFVGAAVVGAGAGVLHLLRSQLGGAHPGLALALCAYALTLLSAAMLFHGVMVAAHEQDVASGPAPVDEQGGEQVAEHVAEQGTAEAAPEGAVQVDRRTAEQPPQPSALPSDGPDVYTFRAGTPVGDRTHRPARRDRSSRG